MEMRAGRDEMGLTKATSESKQQGREDPRGSKLVAKGECKELLVDKLGERADGGESKDVVRMECSWLVRRAKREAVVAYLDVGRVEVTEVREICRRDGEWGEMEWRMWEWDEWMGHEECHATSILL